MTGSPSFSPPLAYPFLLFFSLCFSRLSFTFEQAGSSRRRHDDPDSEIKIGDVMFCVAAAVVIASRDEKVPVGSYGYVHYGACEFGVASRLDRSFEPFAVQPRSQIELLRYLSVYSYVIGLTAWYSVFKVLEVQKMGREAVVVVSGARGAVGSLVGQMCKILGATVIGLCGSDQKVEELLRMGFDMAVNYKSEHVHDRLRVSFEEGLYFVRVLRGGVATLPLFFFLTMTNFLSLFLPLYRKWHRWALHTTTTILVATALRLCCPTWRCLAASPSAVASRSTPRASSTARPSEPGARFSTSA